MLFMISRCLKPYIVIQASKGTLTLVSYYINVNTQSLSTKEWVLVDNPPFIR